MKNIRLYRISLSVVLLVGIVGYSSSCSKKIVSTIEIEQAEGPNPWTNLNWNNKSENFQFVVVTDRTGGNRPGVFEQGVEKVNLLQPEFVMSVGDLIQGYTEDLSHLNQEWDEFDQFVDGLEMPFFYVPGNHDITNKVMEDLWTQRYGRTYYHFVYQDVLFLCLNSEEATPDQKNPGMYNTRDFYLSTAQRNYVQETLQQHQDVRWTFVFWHKPVWLYEESENPLLTDWIPQSGWSQVETWLKDRKHTVFAGHVHRYDYKERNNNDYITLATTGGGSALRGPIFGQFDHVLWVTMTDDGPVMANLMLDGIFDKNFDKDDIENHLALSLQKKVLRVDENYIDIEQSDKQTIKLTLFNHLDKAAKYQIEMENSDHMVYLSNMVSDSIPPNSAVSLWLDMTISEEATLEQIKEDRNRQYARWELVYDFDKYGQIEVNGSTKLF